PEERGDDTEASPSGTIVWPPVPAPYSVDDDGAWGPDGCEKHGMQISVGEVEKVLRRSAVPSAPAAKGAGSLQELAEEHGVDPREVEQQAAYVRAAEEDPWRERR